MDQSGHLYYLKAARHAKDACHPHHGTLIRISDEGTESTVLASGFRAPNGLFVDEEGSSSVPIRKVTGCPPTGSTGIEPGGFYGNKWTGHEDRDRSDYDRSSSGYIRVSIVHHRRSCESMIRLGSTPWSIARIVLWNRFRLSHPRG